MSDGGRGLLSGIVALAASQHLFCDKGNYVLIGAAFSCPPDKPLYGKTCLPPRIRAHIPLPPPSRIKFVLSEFYGCDSVS